METNEKVLQFLNRAQTKVSELSTHISSRVKDGVEADDAVDMSIKLLDIMEAMTCQYNDWSDETKESFVDFYTDHAKLTDYAIVDYDSFENIPILINPPVVGGGVSMEELLAVSQASQDRDASLEDRIRAIELQWPTLEDLFPNWIIQEIEANSESRHDHDNKDALDQLTLTMISLIDQLEAHYDNGTKHITAEERTSWSNKVGIAKLTEELAKKADLLHSHDISAISGLQDALNSFQQTLNEFPVPQNGDPGETPNIQIGSVTEGEEFSITLDPESTVENPILNFVLVKGEKGDSFSPDEVGLDEDKDDYLEDEDINTFLATDTGFIYFKQNGSWGNGVKIIGSNGWMPVLGLHEYNSSTTLLKVVDWVGGTGEKPVLDVPSNWNEAIVWYLGVDGYTLFPHQAVNIKAKGEPGRPFIIDEKGTDRSIYSDKERGFTFYNPTTGNISFKLSDEPDDWSDEFRWLGPKGEMGELPDNPIDKYTLEWDASINGARWVPKSNLSRDGYKGTWNAKTNTPDLTDGGLIAGLFNNDYYRVAVAYSQAEIDTAIAAISNIQGYATGSDASALTIEELKATGVQGVVDGDLEDYKTAIAAESSIEDLDAIQTIVNTVSSISETAIPVENATINGNDDWHVNDQVVYNSTEGFQRVLGSDNPTDVLDDSQARQDRTYSSVKILELISTIVTQVHDHDNLPLLNSLSIDGEGRLLLDGELIGLNSEDIVDDLLSSDTGKALSANQGRILKSHIDQINQILSSDNTSLDTIQEIIAYIQENRNDLDPIISIAHEKDKDQYLDFEGDNQVSAEEIKQGLEDIENKADKLALFSFKYPAIYVVDDAIGNDSSAVVNSKRNPFKTISGAVAQAQLSLGSTGISPLVYVKKGTYNDSSIWFPGVHLYFEEDAVVWHDTDCILHNSNGEGDYRCFGKGRFYVKNVDPNENAYVVGIGSTKSNLYFEAKEIDGISGPNSIENLKATLKGVRIKFGSIPKQGHVIFEDCEFLSGETIGSFSGYGGTYEAKRCRYSLPSDNIDSLLEVLDHNGDLLFTQTYVSGPKLSQVDTSSMSHQEIIDHFSGLVHNDDNGSAVFEFNQNLYFNWGNTYRNYRIRLVDCIFEINKNNCVGIKIVQNFEHEQGGFIEIVNPHVKDMTNTVTTALAFFRKGSLSKRYPVEVKNIRHTCDNLIASTSIEDYVDIPFIDPLNPAIIGDPGSDGGSNIVVGEGQMIAGNLDLARDMNSEISLSGDTEILGFVNPSNGAKLFKFKLNGHSLTVSADVDFKGDFKMYKPDTVKMVVVADNSSGNFTYDVSFIGEDLYQLRGKENAYNTLELLVNGKIKAEIDLSNA